MGPNRILVIKLADIGDAVLSLPAVQSLRKHAPRSRIDVLTTLAGSSVFRLSPAVDSIIELPKQDFDRLTGLTRPGSLLSTARLAVRLRQERYDWVVLLHHLTTSAGVLKHRALTTSTGAPVIAGLDNGRGTFLTHRAIDYGFGAMTEWEYGLEIVRSLGVAPDLGPPVISVPDDARASVSSIWPRGYRETKRVVIHPEVGAFSPARAWPVERFLTVARQLAADGAVEVAFVGTEPRPEVSRAAAEHPSMFDLLGRTTFPELCTLVGEADLVIGADSAVTHLAGALGRPHLALFGPSNARAWKPFGATFIDDGDVRKVTASKIAFSEGLPCSPCVYTGFGLGRPGGCASRTCMMGIDVQRVTTIARDILALSTRDGGDECAQLSN